MLRALWCRLRGCLGVHAAGIAPHPPLAGDRDERRFEHKHFEGETRHVGSVANVPPASPASSIPPANDIHPLRVRR